MSLHPLIWGLGVGWLAGLAKAQAVSTMLATLLALLTRASTLAASDQELLVGPNTYGLNAVTYVPITAAVVGLVLGYTLGALPAQRRWLAGV
jgi:hypothetical protein